MLGPPSSWRPWAPARRPHPPGPPEEAGRSCEGGRGRPARAARPAPEGFLRRGRGRTVCRQRAAPSAWRAHAARWWGGPAAVPETAPAHPGDRFLTQPREGVEVASRRAAGRSAHTPAARGTRAVLPRPLNAPVFLCVPVTSERDALGSVATGIAASPPDSGGPSCRGTGSRGRSFAMWLSGACSPAVWGVAGRACDRSRSRHRPFCIQGRDGAGTRTRVSEPPRRVLKPRDPVLSGRVWTQTANLAPRRKQTAEDVFPVSFPFFFLI